MKDLLREAFVIVVMLLAAIILSLALFGAAALLSPILQLELRPRASSEFANWIQAVGSIIAIVGSYFMGAKQAREAKDAALELYQLDRRRLEEGCRAIVAQMAREIASLKGMSKKFTASGFSSGWKSSQKATINIALQRFDSMPIHEIGNYAAIQHAFDLREQVRFIVETVERILRNATPKFIPFAGSEEDRRRFDNEMDNHVSRPRDMLIEALTSGQECVDGLYTKFDLAFKS